jgi:hypothetical protein
MLRVVLPHKIFCLCLNISRITIVILMAAGPVAVWGQTCALDFVKCLGDISTFTDLKNVCLVPILQNFFSPTL